MQSTFTLFLLCAQTKPGTALSHHRQKANPFDKQNPQSNLVSAPCISHFAYAGTQDISKACTKSATRKFVIELPLPGTWFAQSEL
jgi:hypothetical protein